MKVLSSPIKLIRESFLIFFERKNFIYFSKIYIVLVFFAGIALVIRPYIDSGNITTELFGKYPWLLAIYLLFGVVYIYVAALVSLAGIFALEGVTDGKQEEIREVFRKSSKRIGLYVVLLIVQTLLVAAGLILLVVPGLIALAWFGFATYEFALKKNGVKDSLIGSKKIVAEKFWPIAGRMFIFWLFSTTLGLVLSYLPQNAGSLLSPLFTPLFSLPYFLLYREVTA